MISFKKTIILILGIISLNSQAKLFEYEGDCEGGCRNLNDCLTNELAQYDLQLNKLYKRSLLGKDANLLRESERSWIKFKEADCDFMAMEVNGGREYPFIYNACLINHTKARIADLENLLINSK